MRRFLNLMLVVVTALLLAACDRDQISIDVQYPSADMIEAPETSEVAKDDYGTSGATTSEFENSSYNFGADENSHVVLNDALVSEAKGFALKMAHFVSSGEIRRYLDDEDVLSIATDFQVAVTQYDEPLYAKRYVINRSSLSNNPTGGALTHDEVLSAFANTYPNTVNLNQGIATVATASALTIEAAYPLPLDFEGTQIVELRYSPAIACFVVYTETVNGTLLVTAHAIFGEASSATGFANFASSGEIGATFACDIYEENPAATGKISECKLDTDITVYSADEDVLYIATQMASLVGKRTNEEYVSYAGATASIYDVCLLCREYTSLPTGAIILELDDKTPGLHELYAKYFNVEDVSSLQGDEFLPSKLAGSLPRIMCSYFFGDFMVAAQSVMRASTAYRIDANITPTVVLLVYVVDGKINICSVSLIPSEPGCVLVSANPMWAAGYDILPYYDYIFGEQCLPDTDEIRLLTSGHYVKIES